MKLMHYALVLGLVCLAAALGVAGVFQLTRSRIETQSSADRLEAQSRVIEHGEGTIKFAELVPGAPDAEQVYAAKDGAGKTLGYAALGQAQGYGGKISVMVGLDADAQRIIGIEIVAQQETPGLGTRVADVASKRTWVGLIAGKPQAGDESPVPMFLRQFYGLASEQVKLKKDGGSIQAITGATVSSRGVTEATENAVARIQSALHPGAPAEKKTDATTGASKKE